MAKKVLEIKELSVQFPIGNGMHFNATKDISFDIHKGEVVGLVGESGSGKSTTAKAILGLVEHSTGSVKINNELVPNKPKNIKGRINKWLASKVQMIFQDAKSSLNPREKVYNVIVEGAKNQKLFESKKASNKIKVGKNWLKSSKTKFGKTQFYKLFDEKLKYLEDINVTKNNYDIEYSKIFTKFDDQRVKVKGVTLTKSARINSFKTSYKQMIMSNFYNKDVKLMINEHNVMNKKFVDDSSTFSTKRKHKFIDFERLAVNRLLKSKLLKDILNIKLKYEKLYILELKKLDNLKHEFKKAKIMLHKELAKKQKAISLKWKKLKAHSDKINKRNEIEQKVKDSWKEYKSNNATTLNKTKFYNQIVKDAMQKVSISPEHANRYPGEFSGGQAQRIAIARTIAMNTDLIIADEPISALDVSIQAQVINLLKDLIKTQKLTVLFIAHDLQVVRYISDKIIVMYKGELVEQGPANDVYNKPIHPYTKSLVNAVPSIDDPNRLKQSKAYKQEHLEDFSNFRQVKKKWFNINKEHKVFGTEEQIKRWLKK